MLPSDKRPYCSQEEIISPGSKRSADSKPKRSQQVSEEQKQLQLPPTLSFPLDHLLLLPRGLFVNFYPELATILIIPQRSSNESVKEEIKMIRKYFLVLFLFHRTYTQIQMSY